MKTKVNVQMKRNNSKHNTWLQSTKQTWKLYVFSALATCGIFSFLGKFFSLEEPFYTARFTDLQLSIFTVLFFITSFLWLIISIKCPVCGYRPIWKMLSKEPGSKWGKSLLNLEECPRCEDKRKSGQGPTC